MRLFPSVARAIIFALAASAVIVAAASCGAGPAEHRRESVTTVVAETWDAGALHETATTQPSSSETAGVTSQMFDAGIPAAPTSSASAAGDIGCEREGCPPSADAGMPH